MIIPAPRAFLLLWGLLGLGLAASFFAVLMPAWWAAWWLTLGVLGLDAVASLRPYPLQVERLIPSSLPVGVAREVQLRLHNPRRRDLRVSVYDHVPAQVQADGLPLQTAIPAGGHAQVSYRLTATQRGDARFALTQVRIASPLGLWRRNQRIAAPTTVKVYPNFASIAQYLLLAADHRLSQMGIVQHRRRGEGQDFHQLREYRVGDSPRQVDWKATSRMTKLISREYQDERDQEILFLIDCGHRMQAKDDALSHFDHSLNAVLLLTYVALRQGDAVGLGTFSGTPRWLNPGKGLDTLNKVLNTVYDLEPSTLAPDYSQAALDLLARQRKRAFIIVISNLRDEDSADLRGALALLRRRHRVLIANLREEALDRVVDTRVEDFDDALRLAATHDYLGYRRNALDTLTGNGFQALDVTPTQLPIQLVNRYLELKRSGAI